MKEDKTIRVFKDGCRSSMTEYEVREIDAYGDSVEVSHFPTKQEALAFAEKLAKSALATVVEKHVRRTPAHLFNEPHTYRILATFGDAKALEAGGWTRINYDRVFKPLD